MKEELGYKKLLCMVIVIVCNVLLYECVVIILKLWGVLFDELFFFGGMDKMRIFLILKLYMYFDD